MFGTAPHPAEDAIRAELQKIAGSSVFATASRMQRFMTFIVNKTLAGEAGQIKEYVIGVEVFDRGEDFDPHTDTIVRVEARRLRKKLQEYYDNEGRGDRVLISLSPGSYVPLLELREGSLPAQLSAAPAFAIGSVAVLPFVDMSPSKDQEYFCDGISEELINALSAIPALKIVARTSTFRYKNRADDVRRIGADLGVEHIVEGSVRIVDQRVRVTAQLIRTWSGYHIWSRQFDRELTNIFSIQEELARDIASSVGAEVGPTNDFAPTTNIEAYRHYLEGRHYWRQFSPPSAAKAIGCFQRAVAADSQFAAPYAGLADSYMQMNVMRVGPPRQLMDNARKAASRALTLDSNCAEAEAQLGAISAFYDWDWQRSEQHFQRAIDAQPNYVNAHWLYATVCLSPQCRMDDALAEVRRVAQLDPLSPVAHCMVGAVHWHRHEFEQALTELDHALRLDPSFIMASTFKVFVYLWQNRPDLATTCPGQLWYRGCVQAKLGNCDNARVELARLLADPVDPLAVATTYAGLGEFNHALDWLEKSADARIPQMIWLDFHAIFEPLHATERYRAIREQMHLPVLYQ